MISYIVDYYMLKFGLLVCLFVCLPWQPGLHVSKWKISKHDYRLKKQQVYIDMGPASI